MSVERILDVTASINATGRATIESGGWDNAQVQLVGTTGTATFYTSNDAGAVTGVSDGSSASATNFLVLQGVNTADGAAATTLATGGNIRFANIGQFLRIMGPGLTVTKAFVRLYKIK